jgi:dipeptidase E
MGLDGFISAFRLTVERRKSPLKSKAFYCSKNKIIRMGKIVIIGGGEIKDFETLRFDKRVVELTGKKHPKALFIPTASGEPEGYIETFHKVYGKKLGCKTDVLYCLKGKPSKQQLRKQILSSDLIYVGGGNTLRMVNRWKFLGIDKMLKQAYKKGVVLSGISAGGICWFEAGHSDSMSFYNPKSWEYIKVSGLGLIKGIHCPHFDSATKRKPRRKSFMEFMKKYSGMGIAIDNSCAVEFVGNKYRVISAKRGAKAYKVYKAKGRVKIEEIKIKKAYNPISELYTK